MSAWTLMVQREIADRLAAPPGTKAYGMPSVVVQLACDVKLVRPISRNVFQPGAERRLGARATATHRAGRRARRSRRWCAPPSRTGARRSARSLELQAGSAAGVRAAARAALEEMGHPADERAERLAPEEFVELAGRLEELLASAPLVAARPAKVNLCLYVGGRRAGRPARDLLAVPVDHLADRVADGGEQGEQDEVVCPGVTEPNLAAVALARVSRALRLDARRRCGSRSRRRSRSRPGSAAARPTRPRCCGWRRPPPASSRRRAS